MYTCIVYVCKLCLKNHWVTLHPWVCHLKCSLCLLALPKNHWVCKLYLKLAFALRALQKLSFDFRKHFTPVHIGHQKIDVYSSSIIEEIYSS